MNEALQHALSDLVQSRYPVDTVNWTVALIGLGLAALVLVVGFVVERLLKRGGHIGQDAPLWCLYGFVAAVVVFAGMGASGFVAHREYAILVEQNTIRRCDLIANALTTGVIRTLPVKVEDTVMTVCGIERIVAAMNAPTSTYAATAMCPAVPMAEGQAMTPFDEKA